MADGTVFRDYISAAAAAPPLSLLTFWGRYIGGHFQLSVAEAADLHAANFRILVIYNGATDSPGSVQGGLPEGQSDAQSAIAAAGLLPLPPGAALFVDIENTWLVTSDWIRGWASVVAASGFTPGFYCNPNPGSSVFSAAFCAAAALEPAVANSIVYSCNPTADGSVNPAPARPGAIGATSPNCGPAALVWQYAIKCYQPNLNPATDKQFQVDLDCADDSIAALLW